ncbi:MAG: hypothetical protein ACP5D6_11500 [Kosmotogaceae bacterium]
MKKHQLDSVLSVLIAIVILSGCWIPEDFDAQVYVNEDGSYRFTYEGKLVNVMALSLEKEGKLGKKEESDLKKDVEKLKELDGFETVKYMGKGRYKVSVDYRGKAGEAYSFITEDLQVFSVSFNEENQLLVRGFSPEEDDLQQLKTLGVSMEGSLTVQVDPGLEVQIHNADHLSKKTSMNTYKWNIKDVAAKPEIVIALR